jgi:preprotein translocase subunit SecA
MLKKLIGAVFGTRHEREQKRVQPILDEINTIGERLATLSDDDLRAQTAKFRAAIAERTAELTAKIEDAKARKHTAEDAEARDALDAELVGANGQGGLEADYRRELAEVLDELLPEAFATVREAARRLVGSKVPVTGQELQWDMVHYDVQMVGGIQLHLGRIAEMATGEGKTLVATLPLYLNALPGRGAHLVTVNSYLARRDSQWMGHLFTWLGLTVGCLDDTEPGSPERHAAYRCDITYGTNNEFGFDYLRDNMVVSLDQRVQRQHVYAIVDEVDSVLIDEARTPLIISGPVGNDGDLQYAEHNGAVTRLVRRQTEMANDLVARGEKAIAAGDTDTAALCFYKARMGNPKNKRLLKAMQETGVKQLILNQELAHMADRKLSAAKQQFRDMEEELLFVLDEKGHSVHLTDKGVDFLSPNSPEEFVLPDISSEIGRIEKDESLDAAAKLEARRAIESQYAVKSEKLNNVHQLLRAHALYEKDVNYVVQEGQVLIVDEFTGRTMPGRRWAEGLHQAVEAKENVQVRGETQTLATITIQNYFRLFEKLAGMTGTAETEETEFFQIYGLEVAVIPTNRPIIRDDRQDLVYKTRREKYNGIVEETRRLHELGFPVLVGTTSVEASETLSRMFQRAGLTHNVLNAKYHQREAEIVALAGQKGAITIATNMAGRGTDIKLGDVRTALPSVVKDAEGKETTVTEPGGLHIIGSERHESRRIDRQLRGRAGRQGDPGSSQFFLSLEDDLMRLFGSDRIARLMDGLGAQEGEVLTHPLITRSIEQAQKRVELQNFQSRKRLLDYDDVMNQQREVIYSLRSFALEGGEELKGEAEKMVGAAVARRVETALLEYEDAEEWDVELLRQDLMMQYLLRVPGFEPDAIRPATVPEAQRESSEAALTAFHDKLRTLGQFSGRLLSLVMLNVLDEKWKDHLYDLDQLRAAIGYRSWGQKDPLVEYKQEAFSMFEDLMRDIQHTFAERFLKVQLVFEDPKPRPLPPVVTNAQQFDPLGVAEDPKVVGAGRGVRSLDPAAPPAVTGGATNAAPAAGEYANVGRNDPCPCGSGKKFKKCHGA